MTHAFSFDVTEPTDNNFAGDGDDKIVENQKATKERLELDHWMSGNLDTNESNAEGRHKKVTMKALSADPTLLGQSVGVCTMAESETSIGTCTITNADPAVFTKSAHGLVTGDKCHFTTSDTLPTGLTAGQIYYVIYLTVDTFSVAETYINSTIESTHVSGESAGTVTINVASPAIVTKNNHGLGTGEKVYLQTTGALPTGLSVNTDYYVIELSIDTFKLATTLANALAGTAITTTGAGSGTHTLYYHNKVKTTSAGSGTHTLLKNNGVIITKSSHGLSSGRRIYFSTDGTLPTGITAGTSYYVIYINANTFYIAESLAMTVVSVSLSVTTAGSGTHTLYAGTQSYGVLYTKVVEGVTELFFIDAETSATRQLTDNGAIKMNILGVDLDGNEKSITNLDNIEADTLTLNSGIVYGGNFYTTNTALIYVQTPTESNGGTQMATLTVSVLRDMWVRLYAFEHVYDGAKPGEYYLATASIYRNNTILATINAGRYDDGTVGAYSASIFLPAGVYTLGAKTYCESGNGFHYARAYIYGDCIHGDSFAGAIA